MLMLEIYEQCDSSGLTCDYPVSLWLAFVSMDTHGRPTKQQNNGVMRGLGNTLNIMPEFFNISILISHPSRRILLVRSSQRFLVSTKMMVLFSFSAMISSISCISLAMTRINNTLEVKGLERNNTFC